MTDLDAALTTLAKASHLLIALDFDGVVSPIVPVPADARPLPASASAIGKLATLPGTTVAMVSGRGLADLAAVSGFGAPVRLVGSHGGEFDDGAAVLDDDQRTLLEAITAEAEQIIDGQDGVRLEHKPAGISVHVRGADPQIATRVLDAVAAGPASRPGVKATPGKQVLDLAVLQVNKGMALDTLREQSEADAVLFAGDDVTDETGFARLRPGDVGVKVGDGDTAASHRVADPVGITLVLEKLLALRSLR